MTLVPSLKLMDLDEEEGEKMQEVTEFINKDIPYDVDEEFSAQRSHLYITFESVEDLELYGVSVVRRHYLDLTLQYEACRMPSIVER